MHQNRKFSVTAEGQQIVSSLDTYQASGGKFQAFVVQTEVDVQDLNLNIVLVKLLTIPQLVALMSLQLSLQALLYHCLQFQPLLQSPLDLQIFL